MRPSGENLVSLDRVVKRYAEKVPLDGVSVGVDAGDRCGVIGPNGSGKSTLLRIVAGAEEPDAGRVTHRALLRVSYLPQEPALDPDATVAGLLGGDRYAEAVLDRLGGVAADESPVGRLSGGQRKRVALALALARPADLLVLDEPTNHLDVDAIDWLEDRLRALPPSVALLFVTHDRYLLDRLVNRIIEVRPGSAGPSGQRGGLVTHHGSYADYLDERARRAEQDEAGLRRRANLARTELAWLRRGPQARTSKPRFRIEQAQALIASTQRVEDRALLLDLPTRRIGSRVVDVHRATVAFGDRVVLRDVDLKLAPRARIGVVGPNGSGKTTLLHLLAGRIEPVRGSVRVGATTAVGWYAQELENAPNGAPDRGGDAEDAVPQATAPPTPSTRVLDAVRAVALQASTVEGLIVSAEQLLERFGFDRDAQRATVGELSGGERRRLELLRVLADAPNLLLLDEPTNDLDLDTLATLEAFLDTWPGTLVAASHDRYFLERACDDLYAVQRDGTLRHHPGGWSEYRAARAAEQRAARLAGSRSPARPAQRPAAAADTDPAARRPRKLSYHQQRELISLEAVIPSLEQRRDALEADLATVGDDYTRTAEVGAALTATLAELEAAESRWLELSLLAEDAERVRNLC